MSSVRPGEREERARDGASFTHERVASARRRGLDAPDRGERMHERREMGILRRVLVSAPEPKLPVYPGTDGLGRPLTNEERDAFAKALRASGYVGARLVAPNFARKLTRGREAAHNLMSRVDLRLVRLGWDAGAVSLVKCLCRYVWSEWTHEVEETAAAQRAADAHLQEAGVTEPRAAPSAEDMRAAEAKRRRDETYANVRLEELRAHFEKANDEVNLIWMEHDGAPVAGCRRPEGDRPPQRPRRRGRSISPPSGESASCAGCAPKGAGYDTEEDDGP